MATETNKLPGEPFTITWEYSASDQSLIAHFRIDSRVPGVDPWLLVVTLPVTARSTTIAAPTSDREYRVVAVGSSALESVGNVVTVHVIQAPPPPPINVQVV